jgi:hypothetical protein
VDCFVHRVRRTAELIDSIDMNARVRRPWEKEGSRIRVELEEGTKGIVRRIDGERHEVDVYFPKMRATITLPADKLIPGRHRHQLGSQFDA